MTKRELFYDDIVHMRDVEGITWREIGERTGLGLKVACDYYHDPKGERARARKDKNARNCLGCGKKINTDGRVTNAAERCVQCSAIVVGAARKVWTREAILAAIQDWADEVGEPPAIPDWSPSHARRINDPARARRFEDEPECWPSFKTVISEFGSWNAGISAAGFAPRVAGGGGGNLARRRDRVAA